MTLEGNGAIYFNLKDHKYVENNGEVDNKKWRWGEKEKEMEVSTVTD